MMGPEKRKLRTQAEKRVADRVAVRQAEVTAMLRERQDTEKEKARVRDRVKRKLSRTEASRDLVEVVSPPC